MIEKAWGMTISDIAHIPLHQQALSWGVSTKFSVKQRGDNQFAWRHVMAK